MIAGYLVFHKLKVTLHLCLDEACIILISLVVIRVVDERYRRKRRQRHANVKDKLVYVSEYVQLFCKYNGNKVNISMESGTSMRCALINLCYTRPCVPACDNDGNPKAKACSCVAFFRTVYVA